MTHPITHSIAYRRRNRRQFNDSLATIEAGTPSAAIIDAIAAGTIPAGKAEFARSLAQQAAAGRNLSDKQRPYFEQFCAMAVAGPAPDTRAKASVDALGVKAVADMMARAKESGLRFPKVIVQTDDAEIRLSIAGPNSANPGHINVTNDAPYGSNKYFGRIAPDGTMVVSNPSRFASREDITAAVDLVHTLANDPLGTLAAHGHRTGHCAACNRKLTDPKSLERGIGPVCAERLGIA